AVAGLVDAAGAPGFACLGRRLGVANAVPIVLSRDEKAWPSLALLAAAPGAARITFDFDVRRATAQLADGRDRHAALSYVEVATVPQTGCPVAAAGSVRGYVLLEVPAAEKLRNASRRFPIDAVLERRIPRGTFQNKTVLVGLEIPEDSFRVARGLGV